jgi:hypothetical protein
VKVGTCSEIGSMIVVAKAILDGLVMRTRAEILGPSSSGVAGRTHLPRSGLAVH